MVFVCFVFVFFFSFLNVETMVFVVKIDKSKEAELFDKMPWTSSLVNKSHDES